MAAKKKSPTRRSRPAAPVQKKKSHTPRPMSRQEPPSPAPAPASASLEQVAAALGVPVEALAELQAAHAAPPTSTAFMDEDPLLTPEETARYLRTSVATVYRAARAGEIPASKIGRMVRFRRSDLERLIERGMNRKQA